MKENKAFYHYVSKIKKKKQKKPDNAKHRKGQEGKWK